MDRERQFAEGRREKRGFGEVLGGRAVDLIAGGKQATHITNTPHGSSNFDTKKGINKGQQTSTLEPFLNGLKTVSASDSR